jgi:uncharacterized protein (DUF1810 family)
MGTTGLSDTFNLQRFVQAQDPVYETVCRELAAGRKKSHWMWFVFPQVQGLSGSEMGRRYAISCLDEARAYVAHEVLGERLVHCCDLVLQRRRQSAADILGATDAVKFRSSLTLFTWAAPERETFRICLDAFFAGQADPLTLSRL